MDLLDPKASPNGTYVSTGALPPVEQVRALVAEAHERFATVGQGQVSQVYPALARVDPALFGICVVDATGGIVSVGQAGHEFTIMSVSKPFVFALVCDLIGATGARERLGVNATGYAFNSAIGIERSPDGRSNPMVNAGAIATMGLVLEQGLRPGDIWSQGCTKDGTQERGDAVVAALRNL